MPDDEKPLSPELIAALLSKYHYYIIGFALPLGLCVAGVRGVPGGDECTGSGESGDWDDRGLGVRRWQGGLCQGIKMGGGIGKARET
ncbi:MAG: hypothetical protein STSR0009_28120 [Methanoregula sp.]